MPLRFWISAMICATIPDADVIGFLYGVPYNSFFGHRGFFHSIFFALLLSIFLVSILFRKEAPFFSKGWWRYFLFFLVIGASHGILDAFTDGGLGIALLSPFDTNRYFFPWTPIPVSPIGVNAFFSRWGYRIMVSEMIYLWLPVIIFSIGFYYGKRYFRFRSKANGITRE